MITFGVGSEIRFYYDDGAGNAGTYVDTSLNTDELALCQLAETDFYGIKVFQLTPPTTEVTQTLDLTTTTEGSPPATLDVIWRTNGNIEPQGPCKHIRISMAVSIATVGRPDLISENSQSLIVACPVSLSTDGKFGVIADSENKIGDLSVVTPAGYDDCHKWEDMVIEVTEFQEAADIVQFGIWYYNTDLSDEDWGAVWPNIRHMVVALVDSDIVNIDFHTGALIEKTGQVLISMLGIQDGDFGPAIGAALEYQADGQFGDLDLPAFLWEREVVPE